MTSRIVSLTLGALICGAASAQSIQINPADVILSPGSVGTAKYRLSNTNFDMSLDKGSVSGSGDQVTRGLGNVAALSGKTYGFTLQHVAGQGFIFTLEDLLTTTKNTVSWGTFLTPPPGTNSATLGGFAPDRSFNALQLQARASASGSNTASAAWSALSFTGGASQTGAFTSGSVTQPNGSDSQWIISDTDFTSFNWTLSGNLTLAKNFNSGDELVKYSVLMQNAQAVPEPSALIGIGLAALAFARFRKKA